MDFHNKQKNILTQIRGIISLWHEVDHGGRKSFKVAQSPTNFWSSVSRRASVDCETGELIFIGHHRHSVDAKGRVAIPKGFRKALPNESSGRFVLNIGHDSTIEVHPLSEWKRFEMAALLQYDRDDEEDRDKLRAKLSLICEVQLDSSYRILIPRYLLDYAGLKPNASCVLTGMGRYFEIMTAEQFDQRTERFLKHYDAITSKKKQNTAESLPGSTPGQPFTGNQ